MKTLIVLISLLFVFACGSAKTDNTQNNNTPDWRKKYVSGLMLVKIGGNPSIIQAEDTDNKTLFATTMDISEKDCSDFAIGEISRNAAKIGFNKVTCRDENKLEEWSFPLQ